MDALITIIVTQMSDSLNHFPGFKLETKSFPIDKPHGNTLNISKLAKTRVLEIPPPGRPVPNRHPGSGSPTGRPVGIGLPEPEFRFYCWEPKNHPP